MQAIKLIGVKKYLIMNHEQGNGGCERYWNIPTAILSRLRKGNTVRSCLESTK